MMKSARYKVIFSMMYTNMYTVYSTVYILSYDACSIDIIGIYIFHLSPFSYYLVLRDAHV